MRIIGKVNLSQISGKLPKRAHWHGEHPGPEGHRVVAVIEHYTRDKALSGRCLQLFQSSEVPFPDCARRLDLDPCDLAATLHHDIDLVAVFITEMVKSKRAFLPARLPPQFPVDEGFEQLAE